MPAYPPSRFLDPKTPPHISTLVLLAGISALSITIFLPSLNNMAIWYQVPFPVMQQAVTLYLALAAIMQIFVGPLADRYGRRPVLLISMAIFVLASIGATIAPNATTFIICRSLQVMVTACMVLSRAIVRDISSDDEAASRLAYVTMGMSLVPMIGPVIGGWLDSQFGWQASFGFLTLSGLVVLLLVWRDLGETLPKVEDPSQVSSIWQQFGQYRQLFKAPRFWGYSLAASFSSGTFYSYLGAASFVAAQVFGLGSLGAGIMFGMNAIGYMLGNFIASRLSRRMGVNKMVLLGTAITTGCLGALLLSSISGLTTAAIFALLNMCATIGNGLALPNANAGMVSVRPQLAGSASGFGGAMMIGIGAALAALSGAMMVPGATELPLVSVMLGSSVGSVLAILWVMRRARQIGLPN